MIKFKNGVELRVYGTLQANGAILTSYYDDEYGGDTNGDGNATQPGGDNHWDGVNFYGGSSGSDSSTILLDIAMDFISPEPLR